MGVGNAKLIKLVMPSETQGPDGIEPMADEIANTWAQVFFLDQNRAFEFGKASFRTGYEFIIRYDSALDGSFNISTLIEYNNRRLSLSQLQRVDKLGGSNKVRGSYYPNEKGRYWRAVAASEDIA